jgi:site-specific recombinase XerD
MRKKGEAPPNKGKKYPPEPLTRDEVAALLRAASGRAPTGIRNRALIAVLYRCGLRIAEALSLHPKDLDAEAGTVRVLRGKGRRARLVPIGPGALALVDRWLDTRQRIGINGRQPLFCTITSSSRADLQAGTPISAPYVRQMLGRLAKRAGIDKRVTPHQLRHSYAYERAMRGAPLLAISGDLGHSSARTTETYIRHLGDPERIALGRQDDWVFK